MNGVSNSCREVEKQAPKRLFVDYHVAVRASFVIRWGVVFVVFIDVEAGSCSSPVVHAVVADADAAVRAYPASAALILVIQTDGALVARGSRLE
jgi:hypothetical protein